MYLKQSFKGDNSFLKYFLGTLIILFLSQIIGALPLGIVIFVKGVGMNNISDVIGKNMALILQLFPFITGCLALWICVKKLHHKKFKDIVTTRKSFDFKRAFTGAAIWGLILLLSMIPSFLENPSTIELNFQPYKLLWLIVICLIILPFQTSFEELLFRGYYMQATAVTSKNRWVPLIVTSLIFGLMHSANPEVAAYGFWTAMPSYIIMGLILGIAAIMDNGLELPLGMHFANNFLMAILFTNKDSALQTPALFVETDPSMSQTDNLVIAAIGILFLFICSKVYRWESFKKIFTKIEIEEETPENLQTEYITQ